MLWLWLLAWLTAARSDVVVGTECRCREEAALGTATCGGGAACDRLPAGFAPSMPFLRLQATGLHSLQVGDLDGAATVLSLRVEDNSRLRDIAPGTFRRMSTLRNLSISFNFRLQHLVAGVFEGLDNLTELELRKNGFTSVTAVASALSAAHLPRLLKLSLTENSLHRIKAKDFMEMEGSSVIELRLISCQLEFIHPDSLAPFSNLRALYLGQNPVNVSSLSDLVSRLAVTNLHLFLLNLYGVGLHGTVPAALLDALARSRVSHLVLARNQFHTLEPRTFPGMPRLEFLDLREVVATRFPDDVINRATMPALRTLLLGGNRLPGVEHGVLLPQLRSLDLSANSPPPSRFYLGDGQFDDMSRLSYLNLSYNNIQTLSTASFRGLGNLDAFLGLKNASISYIEPGSFSMLRKLRFLNLENNHFTSNENITSRLFIGLRSLKVLLLGGCSISSFSGDPRVFNSMPQLEYLSLHSNYLVTLDAALLTPLTVLRGLDLSDNRIVSWKTPRLSINDTRLKALFLSGNELTYISPAMMEDFLSLEQLDLSLNPFLCDCASFGETRHWLHARNWTSASLRLTGLRVKCFSPDKWRDRAIEEYLDRLTSDAEICEVAGTERTNFLVWVIGLLVLFLILVIVSLGVTYHYRTYIRYWVFLAQVRFGRHLFGGKGRNVCNGYDNYQYDAFVSYSNEDRNFVVRLVAMLENYEPYLKLCVYERDFEIGSIISESVLQSVAMSRKTLLIISDAFARSHWCMWEMQMVEHHKRFLDDPTQESIILVKLGEVIESNMTPFLKYLLKTRVYLEWNAEPKRQRHFWEKLRSVLAPPTLTISTTCVL